MCLLCFAFVFNIKKLSLLHRKFSVAGCMEWSAFLSELVESYVLMDWSQNLLKKPKNWRARFIASYESSHVRLSAIRKSRKEPMFPPLMSCNSQHPKWSLTLDWAPCAQGAKELPFPPSRLGRVKLFSSCLALKGSKAVEKS